MPLCRCLRLFCSFCPVIEVPMFHNWSQTDICFLQQLEEDISDHQSMFSTLNETGQNIIADLEPGEVLTALQSKLDDMNDRWNSLGVRVVDIRDRYYTFCLQTE